MGRSHREVVTSRVVGGQRTNTVWTATSQTSATSSCTKSPRCGRGLVPMGACLLCFSLRAVSFVFAVVFDLCSSAAPSLSPCFIIERLGIPWPWSSPSGCASLASFHRIRLEPTRWCIHLYQDPHRPQQIYLSDPTFLWPYSIHLSAACPNMGSMLF